MANESLKKLKDTLIQTKKYTGLNINTDSLDKLRTSVNQMIDVMNQARPVGPNASVGNISGTTCGSFINTKYTKPTVSLGELEEHVNKMPIEACSAVRMGVCSCVSRIYINPCDCENRITCLCHSRDMCECQGHQYNCSCHWDGTCDCDHRTYSVKRGNRCSCNGRGCECNGLATCTCNNRTICNCVENIGPSCIGRINQPLCPCNGRCSCNTEKRFT